MSSADDVALTLFVINVPTPQRTPTLDELSRLGSAFVALYLEPTDVDRGWGPFELEHPHVVLDRRRTHRASELIRRISSRRTRVVCVFGYSRWEHILAFATARLLSRQVVTRSDSNSQDLRAQSWLRRRVKRAFLRVALGTSATIWSIGSSNEAYWQELGFRNIVRIPYQVPQMPGGDSAGTRRLRTEFGANEDTLIFLFVGRLVGFIKGLEDLIGAYRTCVESASQDTQLWIVGDGPMRGALEASCRDLPQVRFFGAREYRDLGSYYLAANCVVVPSRKEPWGLVVNEALGLGRYVIASDRVAAADDLVHPDNGTRFEAGNRIQLAQALVAYAARRPGDPEPLPQRDTARLMHAALIRRLADGESG